ncbi:MAG: tetratricopeptide repeat protein [Gemmatimonadota bacterium]|nr:tetratricopeptide repeat protein [Gemmatimonadota bacterium]
MPSDPAMDDEIRRLEEHVRRQPDSLVFARLADAYRKVGRREEALELLDRGITRHPDYPSAHIVRARTSLDLGSEDEARAGFLRALDLDPGNLVALRELAGMARRRDDPAEERSWLERLQQADPSTPAHGDRLAALAAAAAATESDPEPAEAFAEPAEASAEPVEASAESAEASAEPVETVAEPADRGAAGAPAERAEERPWWFDPPAEPDGPTEPAESDADLLTRTMAELYARQGLYEEAEEIFTELLRDRPDDEELRRGLAAVRSRRDATRSGRGGRSEPARSGPADRTSRSAGARSAAGADASTVDAASPVDPATEADPVAGEPATGSGRSTVLEEWLARLAGSGPGTEH